jgi:hypothetical protein
MNMKSEYFIIFIFCLLSFVFTHAQNNMQIMWQGCFGGSENDDASSIVQTDNGYFVLGTTDSNDGNITNNHGSSDIWLVSIDSLGNFLWERAYGGSETEYASNIIKDSSGYYYFGGWVSSNDGDVQSGTHGGYDRWIVKIDGQGNIIWERCYGGSMTDYGGMLKLLSNGNILTYGATFSDDGDVPINYGYLDDWLMIINTDGDIIESRVYGNMNQNNIFDIIETSNGGFFFASKAKVAEGMVQGEPHGMTDVWVVKLDSAMDIEWQKMYGGSKDDYGFSGVLELDDGYIFLASTNSNDFDVSGYHGNPGESRDIWVVRINTIGNILWQRCLGGSDWEFSGTIHKSEDGGFVIFAETTSNNGDVSGNNSWPGKYDIWMVKLSADGELVWQECYGGNGNERVWKGVLKKSEYNYVVAGRASHNSGDVDCNLHGEEDFWVFEIKDCSYYMPQTPNQPSGPDTLCYTTDSTSVYAINPATGAWGYEWKIEPEEAGTILQDTLSAYITWNQQYEGEVAISARSFNDCGNSDWSEVKTTWVYNCVGVEEIITAGYALKIYPNPAKSSFEIRCSIFEIQNTTIEIFDTFGSKVEEINVHKGQYEVEVDVNRWRKGLYLVKLSDGKNYYGIRKVLVQ